MCDPCIVEFLDTDKININTFNSEFSCIFMNEIVKFLYTTKIKYIEI